MLEALQMTPGLKILEIGTGTGFTAALLASATAPELLCSIEIDRDLARAAARILARLAIDKLALRVGDGRQGAPDLGPYDRVIVTAGATHVAPAWSEQLQNNGIIVMNLVGPFAGTILGLKKREGHLDGEVCTSENVRCSQLVDGSDQVEPAFLETASMASNLTRAVPTSVSRTLLRELSLEGGNFPFFLQLDRPNLRPRWMSPSDVFLIDGSTWRAARVAASPDESSIAVISGDDEVWHMVVTAYEAWERLGAPDPRAFQFQLRDGQLCVRTAGWSGTWSSGGGAELS